MHLTNLPELGLEVARLRRGQGLSQRELGKLSGLAQSTLARLETGQLSEFGSRKLLRLLEVLGVGLSVTPLRGLAASFTLDDALAERRAQVQIEAQHPLTQQARGEQ
jgi:HTH-type transcriptional regulator/antitoxin HipB